MLIKRIKRSILYYREYLLSRGDKTVYAENRHENNLLLVRLDAWGDYILFRNTIEQLKKSAQYGQFNLFLLGNSAWKQFAEVFDSPFVKQFVWVDTKQLMQSSDYRNGLIKELNEIGFDVIIHPVYSRQFGVDALLHRVSAPIKIAVAGDARNTSTCLHKKANAFYTELLYLSNDSEFEFQRNTDIMQQLTGLAAPSKPTLPKITPFPGIKIPYAVLFIDAQDEYRRWPARKFGKVAQFITEEKNMHVVMLGRNKSMAEDIIKCTAGIMIIDLTTRTSLSDLVAVIQDAELLISNDTGAVHVGVATGVKTICVSNGNHYGRFVPYPEQVYADCVTVFPATISDSAFSKQQLTDIYREGSLLDISLIKASKVIELVKQMLP